VTATTATAQAAPVTDDAYEMDCGHIATEGTVQACSTSTGLDCPDCATDHARTCRACAA
jgi:hypothetical protein